MDEADDEDDPYAERLPAEDRESYRKISADPDLGQEIRLFRMVLSGLCEDPRRNHRSMVQVLGALIRACQTQLKLGQGSEMEKALIEVAEMMRVRLGGKVDPPVNQPPLPNTADPQQTTFGFDQTSLEGGPDGAA